MHTGPRMHAPDPRKVPFRTYKERKVAGSEPGP